MVNSPSHSSFASYVVRIQLPVHILCQSHGTMAWPHNTYIFYGFHAISNYFITVSFASLPRPSIYNNREHNRTESMRGEKCHEMSMTDDDDGRANTLVFSAFTCIYFRDNVVCSCTLHFLKVLTVHSRATWRERTVVHTVTVAATDTKKETRKRHEKDEQESPVWNRSTKREKKPRKMNFSAFLFTWESNTQISVFILMSVVLSHCTQWFYTHFLIVVRNLCSFFSKWRENDQSKYLKMQQTLAHTLRRS